jgi:hypothetical protein
VHANNFKNIPEFSSIFWVWKKEICQIKHLLGINMGMNNGINLSMTLPARYPIQFILMHSCTLVCHIQKPHQKTNSLLFHFPHLFIKEDSFFCFVYFVVCHVQISQITMLLTMLLVPLESPLMSSGVYLVGFIMFWPNDGKVSGISNNFFHWKFN